MAAGDDSPEYHQKVLRRWGEIHFTEGGPPLTQREVSECFAEFYLGDLTPDHRAYRWDPGRGQWWKFSHRTYRWSVGKSEIYTDLARLLDALLVKKPSEAHKWQRVGVYRDILELAKGSLTLDSWDDQDDLIGLPNGDLWDLRKGFGVPNWWGLPITQVAACDPAEYVSDRPCPSGRPCFCRWHSFVDEACGGDQEMVRALQMAVGASLYGGNLDHRVHVLVGDGGTGKSLFINTVAAALGDLSGVAPASVLAGRGDDHPTGLAGIAGRRLVVVPEVHGGLWKSDIVKSVSGGDTLSVRKMRQDYYQVRPKATLWISTNQLPGLALVDRAIKRRLVLWPFENSPADPDPDLPAKLREMLPIVFQWCLEGAARYAREGLIDCEAVTRATNDYFTEVDSVAQWLTACTAPSPVRDFDTPASAAFKHYTAWCDTEGLRPLNRNGWGTTMKRRYADTSRRTKRAILYPITLEGVGGCSQVQSQMKVTTPQERGATGG